MSAVSLLVENYQNLVWHIIISVVGRNSDCEDLFQEVFLQVLKGLNRFRADARLSTWIGSITHHVCVDYLRKKNKNTVLLSRESDPEAALSLSPEKSWKQPEKDDLFQVLLATIAKLPAAYRTALTLFYLDERSYREIAEMTGMPDGTVKSHISRGRNLLREALIAFVPDVVELLEDL